MKFISVSISTVSILTASLFLPSFFDKALACTSPSESPECALEYIRQRSEEIKRLEREKMNQGVGGSTRPSGYPSTRSNRQQYRATIFNNTLDVIQFSFEGKLYSLAPRQSTNLVSRNPLNVIYYQPLSAAKTTASLKSGHYYSLVGDETSSSFRPPIILVED